MVAHTKSYAKVLLKRDPTLIGKQVIVKIHDIHKWHCYGEIIGANPKPIHVNFEDHFKGMYKVNKPQDSNKMNEIKKEQEDIHATIIKPVEGKQTKPISNTNSHSRISSQENKSGVFKFELNDVISIIIYFVAMYFFYLGLNKTVKFKKF